MFIPFCTSKNYTTANFKKLKKSILILYRFMFKIIKQKTLCSRNVFKKLSMLVQDGFQHLKKVAHNFILKETVSVI